MSPREPRRLTKHMRRACHARRVLCLITAAVVMMGLVTACGAGRPTAHRAHSTKTGGGTSPGESGATGSLPSKGHQEQVLAAAYRRMLNLEKVDKAACLTARAPMTCDPGPIDVATYGVDKLWSEGIDGAGTTIAVIEGWGDPSITTQLRTFDKSLGLPTPRVRTILPAGERTLPSRCPAGVEKNDGSCLRWESEVYLDVRTAHLMAPYANIDIVVGPTPSDSRAEAADQGTNEFTQAIENVSRHHLANVISISASTGEKTFHNPFQVTAQDPGELAAAAAGIPFLGITGDLGTANGPLQLGREIEVWADSPWVTAVGGDFVSGSPVHLQKGSFPRVAIESGAGLSAIYRRPSYQDGVASQTHSRMRSVPDISMDGYEGTSESAPLLSGILALATQANGGHDIGPINPALYGVLGPKGSADGIVDITKGTDAMHPVGGGPARSPGYTAHKGFDIASGWGTINAPRFVPALVDATRASHDEHSARAQATAQLTALQHAIQLSPTSVSGAATSQLTAKGFLPLLPVVLSVDGRQVATLHADRNGEAQDTIDPAKLHLSAGTHTVTLKSELITVTGRLTTH